MSPTLPGTVPGTVLPPGLTTDFNPMQTAAPTQPIMPHAHAAIIPPPPGAVAPSSTAAYLPPFHFAHPEFLSKNPFLPYDLANLRDLRAVSNGRPLHHIQQQVSTTTTLTIKAALQSPATPEHLNTSRVSPASSRPSSSSPPSSTQSTSLKVEVQSTHDQSSDDSDDEPIDVVKSAFSPPLRPTPTNYSIVGIADSTVQESISVDTNSIRSRCDLKAPSSRKPVHERAPIGPQSPETKIKTEISTQKASVWRPYTGPY